MKIKYIIFLIILFGTFLLISCNNNTKTDTEELRLEYPQTQPKDTFENYFGTAINDPYRWLEDLDSEETSLWIKRQNDFAESYLKKIPYRIKIKERLLRIWDYPRASAPVLISGKYFTVRNNRLKDKCVLYYKDSLNGNEIELLNPNIISNDKKIILSSISISDNANYLAYAYSIPKSDWQEIHIKDINTLKTFKDRIQWVKNSSISWDENGFYYSRYTKPKVDKELSINNGNCKIYYHKIGTDQSEDILIYEDPENPDFTYYTDISNDKKSLIITVYNSSLENALYIINLDTSEKKVQKIVSNFENEYSYLYKKENKLYFLTNNNAPRYKIIEINLRNPSPAYWRDFIPQQEGVIETAKFSNNKCIVSLIQDAYSVVKIFNSKGNFIENLDNNEIGTISGFYCDNDENTTFYTFSSFTTPAKVYKYDIKNNKSELYENSKIDFNSNEYTTKQIFYSSKDSTQIPMFIIHKKGIALDGNNPTLLFGYGGFNITLTPKFNPNQLLWLEQGGVIAIANLRGGGEYGENWHKDGTLLKKQNVFDDFIAGAEYLISEKYTSNKRLVIQGGSNGGLLIGAVTNQRPDLFAVTLPAVSIMDMLRYHKLSVGKYWACEYGTCDDSKEMFEYIYKYSPLHNIKEGTTYPAILATTSDSDCRVAPAHTFKYIANLQNSDIGDKPHLIRIETTSEQENVEAAMKIINEITDIYSFAFYNINFTPIY